MTNKLTIHILHSTNTVDSKRKDCGSQEPSSRHYREGACGGYLKNLYFLLILTFTISKLVLEPVIHAGVGTACWSAWWSGEVYGGSGWRHHQLLPKVIIAYTEMFIPTCGFKLCGVSWHRLSDRRACTNFISELEGNYQDSMCMYLQCIGHTSWNFLYGYCLTRSSSCVQFCISVFLARCMASCPAGDVIGLDVVANHVKRSTGSVMLCFSADGFQKEAKFTKQRPSVLIHAQETVS